MIGPMPGSVLIVDDEASFRQQAMRLLAMRGFQIVGEVGDGADAVRAARELEPNAVLLDVNLPDRNGLDVARELTRLPAPPRVLLTSADADVAADAIRACGATAFVAKDELPTSDLVRLLGPPRSDG
jgi:DNA-binding NarL/FixJ family response regulator